MPIALQAKLLRVLEDGAFTPVGGSQEKRVDVRVLAATNADLPTKIAARQFREDIYYRLARFTVTVPPLRERKEDIPLLATHFLSTLGTEMGREGVTLSEEALATLEAYDFPGNIRELKNLILVRLSNCACVSSKVLDRLSLILVLATISLSFDRFSISSANSLNSGRMVTFFNSPSICSSNAVAVI